MDFYNIKGVFFDLGYTLIEYGGQDWRMIDREGYRRGYDELSARGYCLPTFETFCERLEQLQSECRPPDRESLREWKATDAPQALLAEIGVDNPAAMSALFIRAVYSEAQKYMEIADGVIETLRRLRTLGIRTGIISNTLYDPEFPESDLRRLGLKPFLDVTVYSSEIGYRKPHRTIFDTAVRRMGLKAGEIAYVGDRYRVDVTGSRDAGLIGILKYRDGMNYPEPLPDNIPVIRRIPDLLHLLQGAKV